jgi:hypothetical protein
MTVARRLRRAALAGLAVALALLVVAAAPARAGLVAKEPYLLYPGDATRMTLLWQLSATDSTVVAWGPDTSCAQGRAVTRESGDAHQHAWTFTGLAPATRTYWRVTCAGERHAGSFLSAPAPDATRLGFVAYGDARSRPADHDTVAARIRSAIAADPALGTFALFVGDLVDRGTLEPVWADDFFSPGLRDIRALMATVPLQACMGNHETDGGGPVSLFPKYFPHPFVGGRYYSFDYGPAHVAVLDQYVPYDAASEQYRWLERDLAGTERPWRFVLLHEPGWSAGGGHGDNRIVQDDLQPLFVKHDVTIVFGGHNHYYARATVDGVRHLTLGGGGAPLYTPETGRPHVEVTKSCHHYGVVTIDGGTLRFRAVDIAGAVVDSFTIERKPPPAH